MQNPFLTTQSPKFDELFESSITSTPNQSSSFLDSSVSHAFLEDESDEPSFVLNEVQERLNNPVNITIKKSRYVPTPIELRMMLQEKCSQFFLNRTPSPISSQASLPLLLDTPSTDTCERTRTPSMAEQFSVLVREESNSPCLSGPTPMKREKMSESTPNKFDPIILSSKKKIEDLQKTAASLGRISCSPVLSSPILDRAQERNSSVPGSLPVKLQSAEPFRKGLPSMHTSRVRQRLQWTHSPAVNKQRLKRKLGNKTQIIKKTKVASG